MRKATLVGIAVFVAVAGLGAWGQEKPANVGWVYATSAKPGMVKQLEEGRKRHMDFHRKQNDSWRWDIWEVQTGDATGSYLATSFGHSWQDLDAWEQKMGKADTADGGVNMSPYATGTTASIWQVMGDVSHMGEGTEPPRMGEVNHFLLKPGMERDFNDVIKKINDAIVKSNWGAHYTWYSLQDGGEGPHYVLFLNMKGWADLAEQNPSFDVMLEKAVGRHDAESLTHSFDQTIKKEWTETLLYRPDLSYIPGK
jgi:hypothetical protein